MRSASEAQGTSRRTGPTASAWCSSMRHVKPSAATCGFDQRLPLASTDSSYLTHLRAHAEDRIEEELRGERDSGHAPRGLRPRAAHQLGHLAEQRVHGALLRAVAHEELGHLLRRLRREQRTGDLCAQKRFDARSTPLHCFAVDQTGSLCPFVCAFMLTERARLPSGLARPVAHSLLAHINHSRTKYGCASARYCSLVSIADKSIRCTGRATMSVRNCNLLERKLEDNVCNPLGLYSTSKQDALVISYEYSSVRSNGSGYLC